jgi:hypothetical protein
MLSGLGLEATGTVDELRRRLTKFLRDRAAETVVPTEKPATSAPKKKKRLRGHVYYNRYKSAKLRTTISILMLGLLKLMFGLL